MHDGKCQMSPMEPPLHKAPFRLTANLYQKKSAYEISCTWYLGSGVLAKIKVLSLSDGRASFQTRALRPQDIAGDDVAPSNPRPRQSATHSAAVARAHPPLSQALARPLSCVEGISVDGPSWEGYAHRHAGLGCRPRPPKHRWPTRPARNLASERGSSAASTRRQTTCPSWVPCWCRCRGGQDGQAHAKAKTHAGGEPEQPTSATGRRHEPEEEADADHPAGLCHPEQPQGVC